MTSPEPDARLDLPDIHTMIVCIPAGVTPQILTGAHPAHPALGGATTFAARFWAAPGLSRRQRRHLIGAQPSRSGSPVSCAGGRIADLGLALMRGAAAFHAGMRWQQWQHATAGTRPARPWHEYAAEHHTTPAKISAGDARTRFLAQPRIAAMRAYNAAHPASMPLDTADVEIYQAGLQAYQHYHGMYAVCADAYLPLQGERIVPASTALADRITYLGTVTRILRALPATQQIAAVTL